MPTHFDPLNAPGRGGGTDLNPIALLIVAAASVLILALPRKHMVIPFVVIAFFIPLEQRIVVAGLHFMMLRIVLIFGWVRLVHAHLKGNHRTASMRMNPMDNAVVLWVLWSVFAFTVEWGSWPAFINHMGFLYDTFGTYFLLRWLCHDCEDVERTTHVLAMLAAAVAICMVNEQITGRNFFGVFGGVPDITEIRDGRLRSQGAFQVCILAGCFGATLLPLFVGRWCEGRRHKFYAALGIVAASVITLTATSSTAVSAYLAGILGLCLWPLRRSMRAVRWGIVLCLASLHPLMKAPVWALINRVSLVAGASGWHRFELVDGFIRHFGEWWLFGTKTNADWGHFTFDVANQYVGVGTRGGLVALLLFLLIVTRAFRRLGIARKAAERAGTPVFALWTLGAALFAHLVAFFGISYDNQTAVGWYLLLAMIAAATTPTRRWPRLEVRANATEGTQKTLLPKTYSSSHARSQCVTPTRVAKFFQEVA